MTLHDEIAEEMHAYATASTGGVDLCTYTCLALSARSDAYEEERRERRAADPLFAASERARWKRANDARAARKRAVADAKRLREQVEAVERVHRERAEEQRQAAIVKRRRLTSGEGEEVRT